MCEVFFLDMQAKRMESTLLQDDGKCPSISEELERAVELTAQTAALDYSKALVDDVKPNIANLQLLARAALEYAWGQSQSFSHGGKEIKRWKKLKTVLASYLGEKYRLGQASERG